CVSARNVVRIARRGRRVMLGSIVACQPRIPRYHQDFDAFTDDQQELAMPRVVRGGLIQAKLCEPATAPVAKIKKGMTDKHVALIARAADRGAQVVCLQELFNGPYFCAEQQAKWYELTEHIPDG